jgi:phosphoenolpyruvate carboxylase
MASKKIPNIPKCMSTQHPDNVNSPFFAENVELGGEDEVQEAYYAFSHLGCDEQMWDCEGKEVDNYVVKKLLTKHEPFFRDKKLGKDVFLTLRVPNPNVEKAEAKILLETLESIPRSFDAAKLFYGDDVPPIFEVILPMTESHETLDRIFRYYRDFVVGKQDKPLRPKDITIGEWIGRFSPKEINVIPLFETMDHILEAHHIVEKYIADKAIDYQRVFVARSDPAMNYGNISAVLLNKIALQNFEKLSQKKGIPLFPIIGVGSAPFRGGLKPDTVERVIKEYPSAYTFTIQSTFKYDHSPDHVRAAIEQLSNRKVSSAQKLDEKEAVALMEKYAKEYTKQVMELAPIINSAARFVPSRRKRKLHVGLFGYSRSINNTPMPRAIAFTSSLYSLGVPPEILGLNALTSSDISFLKDVYVNFAEDLKDALQFANFDTGLIPKAVLKTLDKLGIDFETNKEHQKLTSQISKAFDDKRTESVSQNLLRAASIRKFLG